jgi:hypothetical protein
VDNFAIATGSFCLVVHSASAQGQPISNSYACSKLC